tara:strand:- start:145 stop:1314 length:1170 start_codon:yes stop_codon:yes gene_type:complete
MGVDDTVKSTTSYKTFDITAMGNKDRGTKSIILKYMLAVVRIKLNKYELIEDERERGKRISSTESTNPIATFKKDLDQPNWTQENYEKAYNEKIEKIGSEISLSVEEKEEILHTQARQEINDLLINLGNELGLFEPDKYKYILNLGQTLEYVRKHQRDTKSKFTPEQYIQKVDRLTNSLTFRYNDINTYMTVLPGWWLRNTDAYDPRLKSLQRRKDEGKSWLFVSGAKDFAFGEEAAGEQPPSYDELSQLSINNELPSAPSYKEKIEMRNNIQQQIEVDDTIRDQLKGLRQKSTPRACSLCRQPTYKRIIDGKLIDFGYCWIHLCRTTSNTVKTKYGDEKLEEWSNTKNENEDKINQMCIPVPKNNTNVRLAARLNQANIIKEKRRPIK